MRNALHRSRTGADDADALVPQLDKIAAAVAAGVAIIPAAGVKRVTLELVDAGDARQFRATQRPVGHRNVLRLEAVAAIGADDPALIALVPAHLGDRSLKQRVVVQAEVPCDVLAV